MKDTPRYFAAPSTASAIGGRLFRKDVLRAGAWIHPTTGQSVEFATTDLQKIASETNRLLAAGVKVPFPDGLHETGGQGAASNNLGHWIAFAVDGDQLVAVCEAADAKVAETLGGRIQDVSIYLEPETVDSHGVKYGPVITHVCATQYPVIERQGNFQRLARAGAAAAAPVPVFAASKEKRTMLNAHLVAVAAALSLSIDGIADDAALEKAIAEKSKALAAEREEAIKAKDAAIAASKTASTALSAKDGEAAALASRLKVLEDEAKARDSADRDAEIKATAEACVGKPEAFSADRQARVKALWPKDRESAREIMKLARESAAAPTTIGAAKVAHPPTKAEEERVAAERLDGSIALARASGAKIEKDASGVYAVRSDKVRVKLG